MNKKQLSVALLGGVMIGAVGFTAIGVSAHGSLTEEERAERLVERQERRDTALSEKVTEGTITDTQKDEIIAFMDELREDKEDKLSREELKELSDEELRALKDEWMANKEARQLEVEAFFEELGVEKEDIFNGSKRGGRHFKRGFKSFKLDSSKVEADAAAEA